MWLEINNINTKIARATPKEKAWVASFLVFKDNSAHFRRGKNRYKPVSIMDSINDEFPTGLLPTLIRGARKDGIKVEWIDKRTGKLDVNTNLDVSYLYDHQKEAVKVALRKPRGIFKHATGSGKGSLLNYIAMTFPGKWIFLVNSAQLMNDIADRWERIHRDQFGEEVIAGRWGDGVKIEAEEDSNGCTLTCCTMQTVYRNLQGHGGELMKSANGILVDEVHTAPAGTFYSVIQAATNAYYRYGFSATPLDRGDKKSVFAVGATGPVIHEISSKYLISKGLLTPPNIKMVEFAQDSNRPTYQGVYSELIANSKKRNQLLVQMAKKVPGPALLFFKQTKHGKNLVKMLEKEGIKCKLLYGKHSVAERNAAIKRVVNGDIDIIVCSTIFDVGVDIPEVQSLINGAGGKSAISTLQKIGRGMRKSEDKKVVTVYDIYDMGNTWMERHSKERLKAYLSEGYQTSVEKTIFGVLKA